MLSVSSARQVPSTAPMILLSSKESIAEWLLLDRLRNAAAAGPREAAAAHKYPVFLAPGNPYNAASDHRFCGRFRQKTKHQNGLTRRCPDPDPGAPGLDAF